MTKFIGIILAISLFLLANFIIPQPQISCTGMIAKGHYVGLKLQSTGDRDATVFEIKYAVIENEIIDGKKVDINQAIYHNPNIIRKTINFPRNAEYILPIKFDISNAQHHIHLFVSVITPKKNWFRDTYSNAIFNYGKQGKWVLQESNHFELEDVFTKTFAFMRSNDFPNNIKSK